jgi:hypothetical protein
MKAGCTACTLTGGIKAKSEGGYLEGVAGLGKHAPQHQMTSREHAVKSVRC